MLARYLYREDPETAFIASSAAERLDDDANAALCCSGPAGAFGKAGDGGETAQKISNASFATLSLIYSFTEVLDLSAKLSTLAGLTARVAQLQEVDQLSNLCTMLWKQ